MYVKGNGGATGFSGSTGAVLAATGGGGGPIGAFDLTC